jgi:hypothetical protein
MNLPFVLLVVAGGGYIYFVWHRQGFGSSAERNLLHLCLGDKQQMKRLIALERRKAPSLSRRAAVEQAIYAIQRDQR